MKQKDDGKKINNRFKQKKSNSKIFINITNIKDDNKYKNSSIIDYFREYTENTSLHGFRYLGEKKKSALHKIWWLLMITLSILGCGYLIYSLWKKWDQSPVIVSFSKTSTPIWTIPFPAITICPAIRVRQSIYNFTEKTMRTWKEEEKHEYHIIAGICGKYLRKEIDRLKYKFVNDSVVDKIIQVSPTLNNTILGCKMSKNSDCVSVFSQILTDEGLCFTANMLDSKEIYRENAKQYDYYDFLKNTNNDGWGIDTGYNKKLPIDIYPPRGIGSGVRSSRIIVMQRDASDSDELCDLFSQGFKIMIHPTIVIPKVSQQFYWVHPGMETMISIKPRMMKTSKVLKNYAPQRRLCYFSNEKILNFFKNYTQENCELECLTNYTMALCGCVTYDLPRDDSMPICGIGSSRCYTRAANNIQMLQIKLKNSTVENVFIEEKAKEIALKCDCLPSCTSIDYDVEISDSPVDFLKFAKYSSNKNNTSYRDMSRMKIFFNSPYFVTTKRSELYGLIDFLANCGGLLGVCLGFSILSLVELIYFATLRLFSYLRSNNEEIGDKSDE